MINSKVINQELSIKKFHELTYIFLINTQIYDINKIYYINITIQIN